MDKLKDFVEQNRSAFDQATPSEGLWQRIEAGLDLQEQPKEGKGLLRKLPFFKMGIAASVILLLSIGYMAGKYSRPIQENKDVLELSTKYGAELVRYSSFVDEKKAQLMSFTEVNPVLMQQFNNDLRTLDESYGQLKNELPRNPNQEQILEQMIDNLNWQIQLLDQQLEVLKEETKKGSSSPEWSTTSEQQDTPIQLV
ncbi:hypothetical protein [Jiulongibacter sp. NS-SX5]|uniref:hypothetical protein n=1 Tax=Jiulongibacter sp. NS-SX5 TaxID=3463854 RepID=UPI00405A01DC